MVKHLFAMTGHCCLSLVLYAILISTPTAGIVLSMMIFTAVVTAIRIAIKRWVWDD